MVKNLAELLKKPIEFPFTYTNPDIKQCSCGQYLIKGEHECIESAVTGDRYCDIVCMVRGTGARWVGYTIIDEFGEAYSEQNYKQVMEVS